MDRVGAKDGGQRKRMFKNNQLGVTNLVIGMLQNLMTETNRQDEICGMGEVMGWAGTREVLRLG
ncbi:unnamed protein product [Prunus armeniaca]|uniref:Uncharacterized protein n=1 Tax=Prunus armeniaca TaxID=36596 RepID=A0A6J5Y1Z1_PRUAR|nr:unnamed protein product [Prunus armeniaca]